MEFVLDFTTEEHTSIDFFFRFGVSPTKREGI
jgi:hypothetical protein